MAKKTNKKKNTEKQHTSVNATMGQALWQKYPNWFALGMLVIVLMMFYYPVLFEGKTFMTPDKLSSKTFTTFVNDALNSGTYPLWNPYIFGGMPSFASLSTAPFVNITSVAIVYAIKLVTLFQVDVHSTFLRIFVMYFLLGGSMYILLRKKGLSYSVAFFGSVAMVLMPQVVVYSVFGHNTKLGAVIFLPVIYLLTERILTKRSLLNFSLLGLAVGLQFLWKHVQISYYTQLMILIYFIYHAVIKIRKEKNIKSVLLDGSALYGAILLGALISSIVYLSVWEYSHYSIRGGGETGGLDFMTATGWSFPPSEILTFLVPSFMGFGRETYWGPMPFTDFPLYFGLLVFMLALLGVIIKRNRTTTFLFLLSLFALLLSFGKHLPILYGPMYKFFPFFNKFRAPKMVHILIQFSMVVSAGFGLQAIIDLAKGNEKIPEKTIQRFLGISGAIIGLILLVLILGKSAYLGWAQKIGQGAEAAYSKALTDTFRAVFLFGTFTFFTLWTLKKKMNPNLLPVIFAILLIWDFWAVNHRFMEPRPKVEATRYYRADMAVQYLQKDSDQFRIFSAMDQRSPNWYMYHKLQHVSGYQGAKLRVYQELIDAFKMPNGFQQKYLKIENGQYALRSPDEVPASDLQRDGTFLKLMNVKYILCPYMLPDRKLQIARAPQRRGELGVFRFTDALPRVYFPEKIVPVQGKQTVLNYITSQAFDPRKEAVIEEQIDFTNHFSEENKAKITSFEIHRIKIIASMKTDALMVLSEMYYPAGWKAYIDGKETKIYKTNFAFRSVYLKQGEHTVVLEFKPKMFRLGLILSLASLLILIAGLIIGMKFRKSQSQTEN